MLKKVLVVLLVVFLGFWMFNDPNGLAANTKDAANAVWDGLLNVFNGLIDFINALTS